MSPHESTNQALRRLGYHRVDHERVRPISDGLLELLRAEVLP